jgi:hypothetical protein
MNKKFDLLDIGDLDKKYTAKILTPIYTPGLKIPSIYKLYDTKKAKELEKAIKASNVSEEEKTFLIAAAKRHVVFNYSQIAEYYANSGKEMQELMEQSALVIIDFNHAIEYGYVQLAEEIAEQYKKDTENE